MEIEFSMIIEMMGRPVDYLKNTIEQMMLVIEKEQGIKLVSKKVHEPKKLEDKNMAQELFTTFAEVRVKAEMAKMFYIVSKYMPSHIEIISPENVKMSNSEFSSLLTEFAVRLHRYDEIAKGALIKNQILENQLRKFQPAIPATNLPVVEDREKKKEKRVKKISKKKRM